MNMLLARSVMIAKQVMSDLISKNPARDSAAIVSPPFSRRDLNIYRSIDVTSPCTGSENSSSRRLASAILHLHTTRGECVAILRFIMNGRCDES